MVAGSTLCLYGLSHGKHYQLTLKRGLAAADGRKLSEDVSIEVAVDDRPSDLAFKADTLILPTNGTGNVPLKAVNVPKQRATLMLVHVTDRQLINEVALGHVRASLNIEDLTAIVQRARRLVWWGSVDLLGERNKEIITALPVGDILRARASWHPGISGKYAAGFVADGDPSDFGPGVYALVAFPGRCIGAPLSMAGSATGLAPCLAFDPSAPEGRAPPREM